ncbi:MAG: hydroxymethylglutaryl-CoA lyase [Peptoniphilaceae bacterium]|nr:hydroxymethylglutaryl-CoA lyase [Peptoniphilaceae bacterium]MDY4196926.1 hydroxymethylglutaryl-CoA lyase [Peptoniphilaceae bacterium]MDY6146563.1 hydroxymethylglutaryl-CoA lyase [Peptoniphilaceae bacterium]
MEKQIQIVEVGPRDGFQSIHADCGMISTETKLKYIEKIIDAGVSSIQFTSFVSPKAIPQLADAKEVSRILLDKYPDLDLFALVPNLRGAKDAYELGIRKVAYVVSYSKSHNKANINRTHEESLEAYRKIRREFPDLKIEVNFATIFGCPFEGKYQDIDGILKFIQTYADEGMDSCVLADTIGIADPLQVRRFIRAIKKAFPKLGISIHLHDTRGLGMVNSLVAIEEGITKIETALGGLGGCPFAPGASGNLATEDFVWMLSEMGYQTGIDFEKIVLAAKEQAREIKGNYSGHHIHIEKITPTNSEKGLVTS